MSSISLYLLLSPSSFIPHLSSFIVHRSSFNVNPFLKGVQEFRSDASLRSVDVCLTSNLTSLSSIGFAIRCIHCFLPERLFCYILGGNM